MRPTLLGLVFDDGNLTDVSRIAREIKREGVVAWRLNTTIADLENSLRTRPADDPFIAPGRSVIAQLAALVPSTT